MKKYLLSFILLIVVFSCVAKTNQVPLSQQNINRLAAIVNEEVITQQQLDQQVAMAKSRLQASKVALPSESVLRQQVLQQMIDRSLLLQLANKTGVRVSHQELETGLARIAKQNNTSVKGLYQSVERQGWTIDEFRDEIRDEIIIQKIQGRDIASRISIGEQEVEDFMRASLGDSKTMPEYHLANILITLPDTPSPQQVEKANKQADEVIKELKSGMDFKKLAVAKSSDSNALQGGDLGWRKLAELPTPFAEHVVKMQPGEIAGPIRTPNGFHVIKLLEKRDGALQKSYEESELQMIYIPHSKNSDRQIAQRMKRLRAGIMRGADFSDYARRYSQDKKTASEGGYLGWTKPGTLNPVLDAAVNYLKSGEVSQPLSTNQGWYLIKVNAKRQVAKSTAAERNEVEQLIFQRKISEDTQVFMNHLRAQSYIRVF